MCQTTILCTLMITNFIMAAELIVAHIRLLALRTYNMFMNIMFFKRRDGTFSLGCTALKNWHLARVPLLCNWAVGKIDNFLNM